MSEVIQPIDSAGAAFGRQRPDAAAARASGGPVRMVGLFSGIGGLETPFRAHGSHAQLLCEVWEAAQAVLRARFPDVPLHGDVATLSALPAGTQVVTAGFPCTDLSQAGRTAGIAGDESGLVRHVFRLLGTCEVEWLILENVRNMLVLDGGRAMRFLVGELEALGFRWAYRLVDSRFCGVPQRRHRVLFVASRHHDPSAVLFADEAGEPDAASFRSDACGFYWTEGLRGLGWAPDGVPPLKGGSRIGIPSPPAIWVRGAAPGRAIVTPTIDDAEALQGFDRGWTAPAQTGRANGPRWKLVGNAVTVGVARWLVGRLHYPGAVCVESRPLADSARWPDAAAGAQGRRWAMSASCWPIRVPYRHLAEVLDLSALPALSARAASGFLERTTRAKLVFDPAFIADLRAHVEAMTHPGRCSRGRAAAAGAVGGG